MARRRRQTATAADKRHRAAVRLLAAYPRLGSAKERYADVAAYDELLAAVGQSHSGAIHLAVFRIEDLTAAPLVAVAAHVAEDRHPDDRRVLERARALGAHAVVVCRGHQDPADNADI